MRLKIELSKTDTLKSNISVENYLQKKIILGGKEFTFFYVYESELMNCPYQEPVDFIKRNNGLLLFLSGEEFRIYNDPFRTVPIYVYRDSNFIRIFSNFEDFYLFNGSKDIKVDKPGFWETIIFESGLGRRTLFEGVKQMPAASILKVNKDLSYTIERYWNFSIELNSSIDTLDNAAAGLYERLDSIFGRLPKDKNYLMGLSGGVDSRLTLAMLSKCFKKDRLKLFTYGFDIRILEYIYAKQVANALGFDTPLFHKLTPESYLQCSDELAQRSAASIGMQHCHDYDFLRNLSIDKSEQLLISTAYSDAQLGWEVAIRKVKKSLEETHQYHHLFRYKKLIEENVFDIILEDLREIFSNYNDDSNFSCKEEYFYCTERNIKFHNYSAYLYNKYISTLLPYANFTLFEYSIGLPIKYRFQKQIIDVVIEKYFKNISSRKFKNISSRFQWGPEFSSQFDYYYFKFLNRINAMSVLIFAGRFQFFNKYLTENQVVNLVLHHRDLFYQTLKELKTLNIISKEDFDYFKRLPYRPFFASERYQLINLLKAIPQREREIKR